LNHFQIVAFPQGFFDLHFLLRQSLDFFVYAKHIFIVFAFGHFTIKMPVMSQFFAIFQLFELIFDGFELFFLKFSLFCHVFFQLFHDTFFAQMGSHRTNIR